MKTLSEEICSLLSGILTTQTIIDKGMLNEEGIDYICERATNHILGLIQKHDKELVERIKELPRIEITHKDGSKSRAILEHSLDLIKNLNQS